MGSDLKYSHVSVLQLNAPAATSCASWTATVASRCVPLFQSCLDFFSKATSVIEMTDVACIYNVAARN